VKHDVTVPYTIEQDEDGVWCAHALLDSGPHGKGVLRIRGHGPCCALQTQT